MRLFVNPNASNLMSGTGTSTSTTTPATTQPLDSDPVSIKLTIVKGNHFPIEKRGPLLSDDIPDCYCRVKLNHSGGGTLNDVEGIWRTSTVENNCHPNWNESTEYHETTYGTTISISVYDEDKGRLDTDDYLGTTDVSVRSLIDFSNETEEIELNLIQHGKISGPTLFVKCLVL